MTNENHIIIGNRESSDRVLVAMALDGDEEAFAGLYRRHAPVVARRMLRILGTSADVEDLLQKTFLQVHLTLHRYDAVRPFMSWLHGISFRVVGNHLRSLRRRRWLSTVAPDQLERAVDTTPSSPEDRVIMRQLLGRLQETMELLPPKKRVAFSLHVLEQMTVTELARALNSSPQTVWARVQSAIKEIRDRLGSPEAPNTKTYWNFASFFGGKGSILETVGDMTWR